MTGGEIMKKALVLLGYTDSVGEISGEQRFRSRALTVLNAVYSDLFYMHNSTGFKPLQSLEDKINLSERTLNDVMPYGVALFLAQSESDGDNQQLFSVLYNQKRSSLTVTDRIVDIFFEPAQ